MVDDEWRLLNRAWWDERTPLHVRSPLYDLDSFIEGRDTIRPFESALIGEVAGLRLLHLQCHFGLDSLSWARSHHASVCGLDFSQPAIDAANDLADQLQIDARFVCCDIYDAAPAFNGEQFDIVYTGLGALNWLPDLGRWSKVVNELLKPGGRLLLCEFHPTMWVFGAGEDRTEFRVLDDYFSQEPYLDATPGTYADPSAVTMANETVEFQHTMAEILTVLLEQGFVLEKFTEEPYSLFRAVPWMEVGPDGYYYLPAGSPRVPFMYGLVARKPMG